MKDIRRNRIEQLQKAIQSRKEAFGNRLDDDWDDAAFVAWAQIKLAEKVKLAEKEIKELEDSIERTK